MGAMPSVAVCSGIPSDGTTATAEDVERGEGSLLDPLPLVVQRPAFLRHGIPRALHLRIDLAVTPHDLAATETEAWHNGVRGQAR